MSMHMLVVPSIVREGAAAALLGSHMSAQEAPMGFTFCPYRDESVERWNFLCGCIAAYCDVDATIAGEH